MPQPTTIGGTLVAVAIIVGLFLWYRFTPHEKDREKAVKFLDDLSGQIENILMDVANTIDITKYNTLEDLELAIFRIANKKIWEFVSIQLSIATENKSISTLVASLITQQNVEQLLDALFMKCGIATVAGAKWNDRLEVSDEAIALEEEIAKRNQELESGGIPGVDEENFIPPDYDPGPINGAIIPPSDEEPVYREDDDSVEFIESEDEE